MQAAIAAADAGRLVDRAVSTPSISHLLLNAGAVDVVAAGKASARMAAAFAHTCGAKLRRTSDVRGEHPIPGAGSVAAGRAALDLARHATERDLIVLLLSGGASSLMALPADGVTLADKQATIAALLTAGADIRELNIVRKHVSAIKGGRLAAASKARMLTLAVSDVIGDDLSLIGSAPGVADPSTFQTADDILTRFGGRTRFPSAVVEVLRRGVAGEVDESPKPGDPRLARAVATVIGGRADAIDGAATRARSLGHTVHVIDEPVEGEARSAAASYVDRVRGLIAAAPGPVCILSAGETTVHVTGRGQGGRNQEFALALAQPLAALGRPIVAASVGTDGIDGPTDAAGAIVDVTTVQRARDAGLGDPRRFLDDNNSYDFFNRLGDLIRTGATGTNVGDVQIMLVAA